MPAMVLRPFFWIITLVVAAFILIPALGDDVSLRESLALAGVAGMLIGTLFPFTILSGDGYQLKGFIVTVLGGFGNPVGALMGGVALGLLEGAVTPFVPVSWTLVIEFALFVLVLIAFPGGIFASRRGAL